MKPPSWGVLIRISGFWLSKRYVTSPKITSMMQYLLQSLPSSLNSPYPTAELQTSEPIVLHDHLVYRLIADSTFWRCKSKAIKSVICLATIPYSNGKNPPSLLLLTCTCIANVRSPRRIQKLQSKHSWFCAVKLHEVQRLKHRSWH